MNAMTFGISEAEPATIARLLEMVLDDRESGRSRTDDEYASLFPGHDAAVRRELASLRGESAHEDPGEFTVAGHRIVRELGRGGQGVVYLAEDPVLPRFVALKLVTGLADPGPGRLMRFEREAEAMASIDHPGICPIYAVGTHRGAPWVSMRHVDGESLQHRLRSAAASEGRPGTRARIRECVQLVSRIARAVAAIHAKGIVHRDLKPGNVMIDSAGQPVVLDFGLAHTEDSTLTMSGDVLGSPAYMSPEQATGAPVNVTADVWALGLMLYESLTLQRPFDRPTTISTLNAIQAEDAEDVRRRNPLVPKDVAVIVMTALDRDPARRYSSALTMAEDLEAWLQHRPIAARPAGFLRRVVRAMRRHPIASTVALASILILAVSAFAVHSSLQAERLEARDRMEAAMADLETGYLELNGGSATRACALFERAGGVLPDRPERLSGHALALLRLDRRSDALTLLRSGPGVDVTTHAELLAPVIDYLERATIPPISTADMGSQLGAEALFLRGALALYDAHHARGDFDLAVEWLQDAVHAAPAPPALYRLQLLDAAGRAQRDDVARGIARGLRIHWPKSPAVRFLAGEDAAGALELDPRFARALRAQASRNVESTDFAGAADCYERAIAIDADDPATRGEFAQMLVALHRHRLASSKSASSRDASKALGIDVASPLVLARDQLERAVELAPDAEALRLRLRDVEAMIAATRSTPDSAGGTRSSPLNNTQP